MNPDTVAALFTVCLVISLVGGGVLFAMPRRRSLVVATAPKVTALVAVGATLGSLYFSERAGFVPCELCWFQRIAMYPMAVILPLAVLRRDTNVMPYALTLAGVGFAISAYHVQVQWFPDRSNACAIAAPCSAKWVEAFGFVTIPQMAALSFLIIVLLSVVFICDNRHRRGVNSEPQ